MQITNILLSTNCEINLLITIFPSRHKQAHGLLNFAEVRFIDSSPSEVMHICNFRQTLAVVSAWPGLPAPGLQITPVLLVRLSSVLGCALSPGTAVCESSLSSLLPLCPALLVSDKDGDRAWKGQPQPGSSRLSIVGAGRASWREGLAPQIPPLSHPLIPLLVSWRVLFIK